MIPRRRSLLVLGLALGAVLLGTAPGDGGILDASWTAPTTNTDGSPLTNLASYRIYYGAVNPPCPGPAFFEVASPTPSPPADQTVTFRLTGLFTGLLYYAAVTAVDTLGHESDCSTVGSASAHFGFALAPTGTVDFGSVALGSFADRPFVAQNASGGTVTVTASTSGPFGVVSGSPSTLGVGESRTVTVRFSPTVPASATANVNFSADGDTISVIVTGSGADSTAPTVAITAPTAGPTYSTSGSPLTLAGTAADNVGVTRVAWVNSAGPSGTATGTTSWTASGIGLQPGTNVLTVTAEDAAGNTATAILTVTLDATVPTVAITAPTANPTYSTSNALLTLEGTASDNIGVTQVAWVNSAGGSGSATGTTSWTAGGIVLQPGTNTLTVTARDGAGNTATATLTVTLIDATAPTLAITTPTAGSTYTTSTSPLTLAGTAADNVGVTRVAWVNSIGPAGTATGTTSWTASGIVLQPGTNVLTVTAEDAAGNTATATLTVTFDATAPMLAITTPTSGATYTTSSSALTLGGTASDNVGVTQVTWVNSLGGGGTASGTTNWTASGIVLQPGTNVLTVTARDAAGNTGAATLSVISDTTAPDTTITASPPAVTTGTGASFSFTATEAGSTFECVLDGGAFAACTSPQSYSALATGSHTFRVRATDAAGNIDPTPASYTWAIDTTAPTVTITTPGSGPTYITSTSPLTLGGTAADDVGVTQVKWANGMGGSGTATGTTSWTASGIVLQLGTNALTVTVQDAAGNTATATVTVTLIDATAPAVAITAPTANPTYSTNISLLTLEGTASDNTGVTQVTWVNSLGGSGTATGTTTWTASGIMLQPGANVLTVTAQNAAGNTATAALTVTYDTSAATVAITAPAAGATVSGTVTVTATATDNIGVVGVQFLMDGAPLGAMNTTAPYSVAWATAGVANGGHTLSARAWDAAGNTAVSADVVVTVANGAPGGLVAAWGFNEGSGTTVLDASGKGNTGTISGATWTTEGRFGSALVFDGTSAGVTVPDSASLALTTMTLEAWMYPTAALTGWRAVIDKNMDGYYLTSASDRNDSPAVGGTFKAGNQNTYAPSALVAHTWTHLAATFDGATVRLYVNGMEVASQAETTPLVATMGPLQIGADSHGRYFTGRIDEVRIYNRALTAAEIQSDMNVGVDGSPTTVTITTPTGNPTYTTSSSTLTLGGTAADNVAVTQVAWVNSAGGAGTATGTTSWTASGIVLQPGTNVLTVTARDAVGNVGAASLTVVSDTAPPTVSITTPIAGPTYTTKDSSLTLGGTATDNAQVAQITWVNSAGGAGTATGTTGWTAAGITLQAGANVLIVTARDEASNTATATLTVIYDTTAPETSITAGPPAATTSASASFSFAATESESTFQCALDGGAFAACTSPQSYSALATGSHTFQVRAADPAGNTDQTPASYTWIIDTTAPTVSITTPASGPTYTTNTSPLTLDGTAADTVGVTRVTWVNSVGGSGTASGTTNWTASEIALQTGTNVLAVTAQDAAGNTATATLTVILGDTTPPSVAITAPTTNSTYGTSSPSLTLEGTASDNIGVTRVTWVNSLGGSGTASGTTAWTASEIVLQPGTNVLTVTAEDAAGNTATVTLAVTVDTFTFSNDPLAAQSTPILAVHILEVRAAIDSVRVAGGLATFAWTDPTLKPGRTAVEAVHLLELQTALDQAYQAAGQTPPTYSDPTIVAGLTIISAIQLNELRTAVRVLE